MKLTLRCSKRLPLIAFTRAVAATNAVAREATEAINVYGPECPVPQIQTTAWTFGDAYNPAVSRFKLTREADVMFLTREGTTTPMTQELTELPHSTSGARIFANWAQDAL